MSEFDGISGFEGWSAKLRDLLREANASARSDDLDSRLAASERLIHFVEASRPDDEAIQALDAIAKKTATALLLQTIDERLASIVARNGELASLGKQFEDAGAGAKKTAAALRLERATKVLEALNDGIIKMKELRDSLRSGSDKDLATAIEKAVTAARSVRSLLEKA